MPKQTFSVNFAQGLDQKSDPKQIPFGNFLVLENSVFDTGGLLKCRNGFAQLSTIDATKYNYLTTFNGNLSAVGTNIAAYSAGTASWIPKGTLQPVSLDTLPIYRSSLNQTSGDTAVSDNGLACLVFTDNIPSMGTTTAAYKYCVLDSVTGQNIIAPALIPNATDCAPRVFLLGAHFILVFTNNFSGTRHLQYIAISTASLTVSSAVDISTQYIPASSVAFDGFVVNSSLYLAWNGSDGGGAIRITRIDQTLLQHNTVIFAGYTATSMSVTADATQSTPVVWATFYDSASMNGYTLAVNSGLSTVLGPTAIISGTVANNIATAAQNSLLTIFYEVANAYSFDNTIATNFINTLTVTQAGMASSTTVFIRSLGVGSKAFIENGNIYVLGAYDGKAAGNFSGQEPCYFLLNNSAQVISQLAQGNGGGYYVATALPSITVSGELVYFCYLFKDLISALNRGLNTNRVPIEATFSQTGINLATFTFGDVPITTAEIGNVLNISGGMISSYDGSVSVENNFFLFPDLALNGVDGTYKGLTTSTSGGNLQAQIYNYVIVYNWINNQGNADLSGPSIPVSITTTGTTSSNTIIIPTLRVTYKTNVVIQVYRSSTGQETFYEVTSPQTPLLNDPSVDTVTFVDTLRDEEIVGNTILYTTGGVLDDTAPPGSSAIALYKSRVFLVDQEDQNLLWYSKQVIEATPVEFSTPSTIYVAPTTAAQGNTGPIKALSAMDDKLIIFKRNAMYYITGTGPDNTGANNDFSDPIFITSTVGCSNQNSIVFIPPGIMFQSDKGIWLLGRDLSTNYIGAPVESYNANTVLSALNIPGTNQVRFTLDSGVTLLYDYFYNQWGTFNGVAGLSSTLYRDLHAYIDSFGRVFQESPNTYQDGSNPTLLRFSSAWIKLSGLQGYQRCYYIYLLGTYISPHKLIVSIAYDYNTAPSQIFIIDPSSNNISAVYGGDSPYGQGSPYGGPGNLEQWKIHLARQTCQAIQISVQESFNSFFGPVPGAGLSLSGLNFVINGKKGYRPIGLKASQG